MKITTKLFWFKKIALTLVVILLTEICLPGISWALTSGPSKPEIQSFEPVTTTEMVDLFSGDFTYNIPLFELPGPNGGYPFNLHYNAGVNMDQEASWVGLGWNLNPGAITRNLQGLPDEYNGASIQKEADIRPNSTYGATISGDLELLGADSEKLVENPAMSLGVTLKYNNYKGFGYALDIGAEYSKDLGNDLTAGVGLNLSLDSENGIGVNLSPSLSSSDNVAKEKTKFQIGVGYSSRQGLNNYSFTVTRSKDVTALAKKNYEDKDYASQSGSSAYTVMSGGYIPPMSTPMDSRYTTLSFKPGFGLFGVFGNISLQGFYSSQFISSAQSSTSEVGYGYLYSQNDNGSAMLDFNREKDGMLHKNSDYLPVPVATADIFTMTSQGGSSMFRAFRNDAGVYHDLAKTGENVGGSAGVEVVPHFGIDATFGYGETKVLKWIDDNDADGLMNFSTNLSNPGQEAYYFQSYGESTTIPTGLYSNIGGEDPVSLTLDGIDVNKNRKLTTVLKNQNGTSFTPSSTQINTTTRAPRNNPVQYIDPQNPALGMYSINSDGSTYIFGKAQRIKQSRECMYSVDGSGYDQCTKHIPSLSVNGDKPDYKTSNNNIDYSFSRTTLTDYPYTYLISEIRGADYVDANGDGVVSNGDKGYWVKFTYQDVADYSNPYKFRAPYYGGNFLAGKLTTIRDNKATYTYGEKEVSYLTSVETNSHIAEFHITARKDARGASGELANTSAVTGANSYKLEYISLRSKADLSKTLMNVYFDYSYDLCKGVWNNDGSVDFHTALNKAIPNSGGKLTLKKVWIEYENNTRGRMNPYKFDYHETVSAENPNYVVNNYDRWGFNRATTATPCDNPYVPQFNAGDPNFKANADQAVAAWSMKSLTLPSGALINVTYESDDYGYVQDKRAGQMFKMHSLSSTDTSDTSGFLEKDYSGTNQRKIIFILEKPLLNTSSAIDTFNSQYIEGLTKNDDGSFQLYYRLYGHMMDGSDGRKDYVSGYADIDSYGLEPLEGGKYTKGYIIMKAPKIGSRTFSKYHPFAVAFWQALMTDYSELPFTGSIDFDDNEDKEARRAKLTSLVSVFGELMSIFTGFYSYANQKTWGRNVDLSSSYIRLCAPDRIKLGGGLRVKQITLSDQWNAMHSGATASVYGQVYDYTTTDSKGNVFSSGVATYEPMTGGDENSLRGAKAYIDKIPLKLSHNLFFETPINESYYPGASVGYAKVTVKSLASYQNQLRQTGMPAGILTTGAICNEFYTCRDFPVKTFETPMTNKKDTYIVPLPLIGGTTDIRATASKGYSIQLNDMHGKPKKTSVFSQAIDGSIVYDSPVSYIEYKYKADKISTGSGTSDFYLKLNNQVPVLIKNSSNAIVKSNNYIVGEKIEFFTDMREQVVNNSVGGVDFNIDIFQFTIATVPIPVPWPSVNYNRTRVRTVVTNKIVHKFGIVDSIIAYNGGSTVRTKNLVFDGVTGQPVLTVVTNNFDDPVFNFNLPAHMVYSGLDAAYASVGATFTGSLASGYDPGLATRNMERLITVTAGNGNQLVTPGDILTFYDGSNNSYTGVATRVSGGNVYMQTTALPSVATNLRFYISRPGNKNQLNAMAGGVTTLGTKTTGLQYNPIDQLYPTQP